jgi:hypothetical protein
LSGFFQEVASLGLEAFFRDQVVAHALTKIDAETGIFFANQELAQVLEFLV